MKKEQDMFLETMSNIQFEDFLFSDLPFEKKSILTATEAGKKFLQLELKPGVYMLSWCEKALRITEEMKTTLRINYPSLNEQKELLLLANDHNKLLKGSDKFSSNIYIYINLINSKESYTSIEGYIQMVYNAAEVVHTFLNEY